MMKIEKISAKRGTAKKINEVLTLENCKETLNKGERKYKDEEIKKMREYLYFIAGLQLEAENNELKNCNDECNYLL